MGNRTFNDMAAHWPSSTEPCRSLEGLAYHGVSGPKQRLCPPRVQPFSHDEGNRRESHASSVCRGGHRLDPYEQKTQQSPGLGRSTVPHPVHS